MSKNSSTTKGGFTLSEYLRTVARNSKMGHDTNWDENSILWFTAKKTLPYLMGEEYIKLDLGLLYSDVVEDWYIYRFSVGYYYKEEPVYSPYRILDGEAVLTHHAKRLVKVENIQIPNKTPDLKSPTSELWRIHSPANLEALFKEYINLAQQRDCIPVFSLYPKDKPN